MEFGPDRDQKVQALKKPSVPAGEALDGGSAPRGRASVDLPAPRGIAADPEKNILYENGPFYAFQVKTGIEIRKNGATHAAVIGTVKDYSSAVRFIDRAAKYPNNF